MTPSDGQAWRPTGGTLPVHFCSYEGGSPAGPVRSTPVAASNCVEVDTLVTTGTTIHGHRPPWFGKTVVRALATAAIVVVALLFALQLPVAHAQAPDQAGTVALSTTTPQVGVAITATLTDADNPVTGTTWRWSSLDSDGVTYTNISGATSASYTPVAADHGKFLKATASYTDMHGPGNSAEKVADNAVANVPVEVSISVPDASVAEGSSATVTVTLSADPKRTVVIPTTTTNAGGASDDDYSGVPENVTFNNGQTTKTFTFMATDDSDADHGESVELGFGTMPDAVSEGTDATITITIIDDDPAVTVDIEGDSGTPFARLAEGESVEVTVRLNKDAMRPLTIPITATTMGGASAADYMLSATSVTIASGETSGTLTLTATDDTDEDHGESVRLTMGTKSPGVTLLLQNYVTVNIADNDPAVTVSFRDSTHRVAENDSNALRVFADLSQAPKHPVSISLTVTYGGGATAADHVTITQTLSFGANATSADTPINVTNDMIADHGETIQIGFRSDLAPGVSLGANTTSTITIIDDDPAVTVEFGSTTYSAVEGAATSVTVTLSEDPKRPLTIPITNTAQGSTTADDYTFNATEVTFSSGQTSKTVSFSAAQDTTPDHGDSVKLGFGTDLPPGVTAGDDDETTVTIIDDDPAVTVSFGAATYSVDESGTVDVTLTLSADPQRPLIIPVSAEDQSGATPADHKPPGSVTFASGDMSQTLTFTPENDTVDDDEKVKLSFGTPLPPGVTAGTTSSTVVSINDDDDPEVTVRFGSATYSVNEKNNGTVTVTVGLSADPERTVSIPLTTSYGDGADSTAIRNIPSSVSFSATETSKTFIVSCVGDRLRGPNRHTVIRV